MHPAHFNLHPAHLSIHPALCNTLNVIWSLILHVPSNFPKFRPKNSKLSILTENWLVRELGGAESKSGLSFWNSDPKTHFWANLSLQSQSYQFCLKIDTHGIWRMLILLPTLVSWICNPKSIFKANLGQKGQSCLFWLKIGTQYLQDADSYSVISFLNFLPKI